MTYGYSEPVKPLQTHGIYITTERWIPPRWPFATLDTNDESWMRPCMRPGDGGRFGKILVEKNLKPLYDVRARHDRSLIGYTDHNPAHWWNRGGKLILDVVDEFEHDLDCRYISKPANYEFRFRQMAVNTGMMALNEVERNGTEHRFQWVTWMIPLTDAPALAAGGFIQGYGPDKLYEFVDRIRERIWKASYGRY